MITIIISILLGLGVGERDDLSDVIESLGGSVRRPDTANSHTSGTHSERSQLSQHRHHSQEVRLYSKQ